MFSVLGQWSDGRFARQQADRRESLPSKMSRRTVSYMSPECIQRGYLCHQVSVIMLTLTVHLFPALAVVRAHMFVRLACSRKVLKSNQISCWAVEE